MLKYINKRLGLTIVLITHEMSVIREICDEVLVLEQGRIAETGPVWRIFGNPRHDATRALLQPLHRDIPEDIALHLKQVPSASEQEDVIVELTYTGEGGLEPDLVQIAAAIGAPVRLLQSSLDRIQGHAQGKLLIASRGGNPAKLDGLAQQIRVLCYVAIDV